MAYHILIVDDDEQLREELYCCLDDYKVIEAKSAEEALQILKKPNLIDLVILDIMMPGMHGTEALPIIKKSYPKLPVIMLTGRSSKDVAIESLKGHADDYIEKPFKVDDFLAVIKRMLSLRALKTTAPEGGMEEKVAQAKYFITRNFDKKISLNDMADQLCLSPKYFSRIFKEMTGVGFNEYRLSIKVDKSKELLENTSYTISELADQLGYKNTESFIRVFKELTGLTPQEFRHKKAAPKGGKRV